MTKQTMSVLRHPHYTARRRNEGQSLLRHMLGLLLVLGALVMMAKG